MSAATSSARSHSPRSKNAASEPPLLRAERVRASELLSRRLLLEDLDGLREHLPRPRALPERAGLRADPRERGSGGDAIAQLPERRVRLLVAVEHIRSVELV